LSDTAKVTIEDIEKNIASEHYFTALDGVKGAYAYITDTVAEVEVIKDGVYVMQSRDTLGLLTFCVLVLKNGFTVTGQSACVDPKNFDQLKGRTYAREDAINKVWPLMGYALKDRLNSAPA
jgi:hypothetical protein